MAIIGKLRKLSFRQTAISSAVVAALLSGGLQAAEHPNTKVNYDASRNVNVIDMVMSIDWDFDSPPAGLERTFIENILKQSSQSLYTMTEGRQMLGKVFVYKNGQFMNNTDIQYLQKDGRANAHIGGIFNCQSCRNQMFAGTGETAEQHGKTLAHEFGHYVLALYDEYREVGGTSTEPGSPQDGDTPRDSIMHNHLGYVNLSTASDYPDASVQKTAHFRTYGKSAWEVLVSDPASDQTQVGRTQFDPFKNIQAPTAASLTRPATGWENDFQVVYMGSSNPSGTQTPSGGSGSTGVASGTINAIIIDTATTKAHLDAQINAAVQAIDATSTNGRVIVYAHPFSSTPVVPLTVLTDTTKSSIKTTLSKIGLDTAAEDTVVGDRLFDWAQAQFPSLFPSVAQAGTAEGYYYRFYSNGQALGIKGGEIFYLPGGGLENIKNLGAASQYVSQAKLELTATLQKALDSIKAVRTDADTPSVTLFTNASATVDSALMTAFRDARVSINPVALVSASTRSQTRMTSRAPGKSSLFDLAKGTLGKYEEAAKAGDLARSAGKVANAAEGDNVEVVTDGESPDVLAAGGKHSLTAKIAAAPLDGEVTFQAYWSEDDDSKLSFSITTPSGTVITPTTLPAGVTYTRNAGEGEASFTVSDSFSGRAGNWASTITASAATDEEVFQEVMVKSNLSATLDLFGGSDEDTRAMFAEVELSGPLPVKGASVSGDVHSASSGQKVGATLTFKDDGVAPDKKAGDGKYTASLSSLAVGEYELKVAVSNDGTAVFSTAGSTKKGSDATAETVPAFQRSASEVFKKVR